jgi:urease accessory protein
MRRIAFLAALLAPLPALAHPGGDHVHGLLGGFAHPFGGLDHLAAMIAVGLWAGLLGGAARLRLPAAFLAAMLAGLALGALDVALPMVEGGILASVVVLGALVCLLARVPAAAAAMLVGFFGLLHGHAHGTEMAGAAVGYALGMVAATALLLVVGVFVAAQAGVTQRLALRIAGGAASVAAIAVAIV